MRRCYREACTETYLNYYRLAHYSLGANNVHYGVVVDILSHGREVET